MSVHIGSKFDERAQRINFTVLSCLVQQGLLQLQSVVVGVEKKIESRGKISNQSFANVLVLLWIPFVDSLLSYHSYLRVHCAGFRFELPCQSLHAFVEHEVS